MRPVHAIALVWIIASIMPAAAQVHGSHQHGGPATPYAGMEHRAVKALSDQQIADLRAGRGMRLASLHVLEHADALALTPEQRVRTKALFEAMKAEAVPLGERLIAQERELEHLFASGTVQRASLEAATGAVGGTQGQLRAAHLRYHLAMMDVLTPERGPLAPRAGRPEFTARPAAKGRCDPCPCCPWPCWL